MRKQTKLVAVASAAALLAIGASMTSFAATGWVEEGGEWFYYDSDGSRVEDEWKKSGDKWFWLDSEESGAMAIDKLVSDDDYTYYVDSTGAMVSNTWVRVVNEEQDEDEDPAEYNYYYMQSSGKAYKATGDNVSTKFKTIDGKRYAFDEDGKMLYGWVNGDAERLTDEEDWATPSADVYYLGNWDDGAMKTGWQKITVYDDKEDDDMDHWFFFNSNGKRYFNDPEDSDDSYKMKTVNGKKYGFDERGVMVYQWNVVATDATASPENWRYFNSPEDGARVTKGWFKVIPAGEETTFTDDVDTYFDENGAENEDVNWYYAGTDGELYAGKIAKIKGKYYGFNPTGKMLSGLVFINVDPDNGNINFVHDDGVDVDELDDIMADAAAHYDDVDENSTLYYFGSDADSDGAMKTGNVTVNVDGDSHNFKFSTTGAQEDRGRGVTGVDDNKYIYKYGKRIKAGSDDKYKVVTATGNTSDDDVTVTEISSRDLRNKTKYEIVTSDNKKGESIKANKSFEADQYLVNTSGTIIKNKTAAKDGDEWYFYVDEQKIIQYTSDNDLKGSDFEDWRE